MSYMHQQIGKNDTLYHPINPQKYRGNINRIVCRSSWETIFCRYVDNNKNVVWWNSESVQIPYIDKTSRDKKGLPKKRRYYPDFLVCFNIKGENVIYLIEVKPKKECSPPLKRGKKSKKTMMYEQKTWAVNSAKWRSAESYCRKRGWIFRILTEDHLIKK